MRRNVVFDKGRNWRPEDDEYRRLDLDRGRGAEIGEYASREPGEYSDSYYGPGDRYPRRHVGSDGYVRGQYGPRSNSNPQVGGIVGRARSTQSPDYVGYGELHPGERSWADLGVSSVRSGEGGLSESNGPSLRGRGPKGYARSDQRVHEIVCERLTEDPHVDASDIEVAVKDGEITLTGYVSNRTMKWRAEDLVENCTNGALVHNRLRVQRH